METNMETSSICSVGAKLSQQSCRSFPCRSATLFRPRRWNSSFSRRYAVYVAEIQKRSVYIVLSFLVTWFCAYTQKMSLLYSMTCSLQQALPDKLSPENSVYNRPCWSEQAACQNRVATTTGEQFAFSSTDIASQVEGTPLSKNGGIRLIFTDVEEAFYTLFSVSLFWCVLAWFPVLLYHTLCFFQPGFYTWQNKRAWLSISGCVLVLYGVFQVVDLFVIPRLVFFFYSFQIQRSSLYLDAETKVVSYVSLYVFVYCVSALFLLVIGGWVFYRQRQITRWLHLVHLRGQNSSFLCESAQYKDQRAKLWWGCLFFAALISPPEILSQLVCTLSLIACSEISIWLAYIFSCRFWNKMH